MKDLLFMDNHILVVAKPQNVDMDSFAADLRKQLKEDGKKDSFLEPIFLLDTLAGGITLFALSSKAVQRLKQQCEDGELQARFYAICVGKTKERNNVVTNFVAHDPSASRLAHIPQFTHGSIRIENQISLLEAVKTLSLIRVSGGLIHPEEVRFVLFDNGAPVFGDKLYGGDSLAKNTNTALYLAELRLVHPTTGKNMTFRCFPPVGNKPWSFFDLEKYLRI